MESGAVDHNLSKRVPTIAIHTFYKNYVEPSLNEGFQEIIRVKNVPYQVMDEKEHKKV